MKPVMVQSWRKLLFLHWQLPADELQRKLPPGLTVDTFEGSAYVGLVAFTMLDVRPPWLPRALAQAFHETNVRTYVTAPGGDPGVWFFSLDAASRSAVVAARATFKLPYHFDTMQLVEADGKVSYRSDRHWPKPAPAIADLGCAPQGSPEPSPPATLQHFLIERYVLYAARGAKLWSGRVRHPPYGVQHAAIDRMDETLLHAAGFTRPAAPPLVHYSPGVDVEVFPLRRHSAG
jgi:uncharacterized protein